MDSIYIEPFGVTLGGTLTILQLLDHSGIAKMPWNPRQMRGSSSASSMANEESTMNDVVVFIKNNVSALAGFTTGYLIGYKFLDWTELMSESAEEVFREEASSSPSSPTMP